MCKKITLGLFGLLLVGGLLFGSNLIPYASTAFHKVRSNAQAAVPIDFQIETAKEQLSKIGPEIHDMNYKLAKEKAQIARLSAEIKRQDKALESQYDQMMTLREAAETGEGVYVSTNGTAFTAERVKEDLRHRFNIYKTTENTKAKSTQILELRRKAYDAAKERMEEAKAQQRELEVQIANLTARQRMVEVAKTASHINLDNSQLSKTREMIEDIALKIDTEEELMNMSPEYFGQIPVGETEITVNTDVLKDIDSYFNKVDESEVVNK